MRRNGLQMNWAKDTSDSSRPPRCCRFYLCRQAKGAKPLNVALISIYGRISRKKRKKMRSDSGRVSRTSSFKHYQKIGLMLVAWCDGPDRDQSFIIALVRRNASTSILALCGKACEEGALGMAVDLILSASPTTSSSLVSRIRQWKDTYSRATDLMCTKQD